MSYLGVTAEPPYETEENEMIASAYQIKIRDAKHLAPLTSAYLLDTLGYAAQVERDGTAIYYWGIDRGPIPNLCDCGLTRSAEIELVYEADEADEADERDATRKELADEDASELARLERLEIERRRLPSDEDAERGDPIAAQIEATRLVATYSRQAITEAHECNAHLDALAGEIGFSLLPRYDDLGIDALIRIARSAIIAREFCGAC